MSHSFTVRLATIDDVPQILSLQEATAEAPNWGEAVYRGYVEPPSDALQRKALLIAEEAGCVIGCAAITVLENEAELESIAVAEAVQRCGLGTALLKAAMRWAATEGAETLRLEVRAKNIRAQGFYASNRFDRVGLRRAYYRDPVDDGVAMQRSVQRVQTSSRDRAGDL